MVVMTAPAKASGFENLEAGVYRALLKSVDMVTSANPFATAENGEDTERTQFEYVWAIDLGEDEMAMPTIKSWTTASVHPKSNAAKVVLPALGVAIPQPGEDYDTDDWVGKECQVMLVEYSKKDGSTGLKIGNYLAPPKKASKKLF